MTVRAVQAALWVSIGAVEFGLTLYGPAYQFVDTVATPYWPPAGFSFAVLLLAGFRYLPALAVGSWAGYAVLFHDYGNTTIALLLATALTAGVMAQASIGTLMVQRFVDLSAVFERANQTILFFAILLASTLFGSLHAASTVTLVFGYEWSGLGQLTYAALVGASFSTVHLVSFAMLWSNAFSQQYVRSRIVEFGVLVVATIVTTTAVFTDALYSTDHAEQHYLVFPLVLWAVFRFFPREMIVMLTIMSAITIYGCLHGTGPFQGDAPSEAMLNTLTYIVVGVLVALTLSTIAAQQKRAEFRLRRLNNTLESRVQERTAELASAIQTLHAEVAVRHQAERALAESQDRKAAIVDTSLDGIVTIRSDGSIAELNPAAQAIFGFSSREIARLCFADLIVSREATKARELGIEEYLRTESRWLIGKRVEMYCRRADQTEFPVEISMVPVIDTEVMMYICNVRDITHEKLAEREREILNQQLIEASHRAGMAEIANGVLHNIGNVLNSVNVSAAIIAEKIRNSRLPGLDDAIALIAKHTSDLGNFLTTDSRGVRLVEYLSVLSAQLHRERDLVLCEFNSVSKNVMHIKEIISRQQSYASQSNSEESTTLADLVEQAIDAHLSPDEQSLVNLQLDCGPNFIVDRHNALQIVGNLLQNARDAVSEIPLEADPEILITGRMHEDSVEVIVADNGIGIEPDKLPNVFHYAYTTKKHGHGFGLHASQAAARNMGGELTGHSDGAGQGARFVLKLPLKRESSE